jgi:hypothetical protein
MGESLSANIAALRVPVNKAEPNPARFFEAGKDGVPARGNDKRAVAGLADRRSNQFMGEGRGD